MTQTDVGTDRLITAELRLRLASLGVLSQWERAELGRDLRRAGLSYGEIGELIPAAKATIAGWCRGIDLTDQQRIAIQQRTGSRKGVPVDTQWRRRREIDRLNAAAQSQVGRLRDDARWVAGLLLYWAEGSKTSNGLRLANSDPDLIRMFMRWVVDYIDPDVEFRAQLSLHAGNDEQAALEWWSSQLRVGPSHFLKAFREAGRHRTPQESLEAGHMPTPGPKVCRPSAHCPRVDRRIPGSDCQ